MLKRRSGLGSLIPGSDLGAGSGPEIVPISVIAVNPYQPRRSFDPAALDELAESIRRHGILQPLTVRRREGGYELIAGERRLQAARMAGLTDVPVLIRECSDEESLELALVENLQREDLNPMEAAHSYRQLLEDFGLSQADVAERVGKSRSAVANTLRLLGLAPGMQEAVAGGIISEGHARALLGADEPRRELLFQETVARGLSVRALEALVAAQPKAKPAGKPKAKPAPDANMLQVQDDLQSALGTKVRFRAGSTHDKGVIEIEYYSADDLERIYEAIHHE
jgi:ParB family chromosome partitioning protein